MENPKEEQSNENFFDNLNDTHKFILDLRNKWVEQQDKLKRIEELEQRHQLDCIKINQLNTTIDILVDKLAQLRRYVEQ